MNSQLMFSVIQFPKSSFKFIIKVRHDLDIEYSSHINVLLPLAPPAAKLKIKKSLVLNQPQYNAQKRH